MDSVEIRGLHCRCIIGIRARERRVAQRVRLDLDLQVDLERAGKSGRIAHTVDYSRASTEIIALLQFRCYSLLELAAEECAGWLFAAYPMVSGVSLGIAKPQALAGQADSGGVRIFRKRPAEVTRQRTPFGFIEPQLETSEATISLVGLDPGATLTPSALGARQALLLPLTSRLQSERPLASHEPSRLRPDASCTNQDAAPGLLVVCAQRHSQP
ncbi:MAG: dihydroneopterin aldolase [Myxococcales bacterium]|nr:MAG: dihydroneopterin aldolase [Myxococcales bacterium]